MSEIPEIESAHLNKTNKPINLNLLQDLKLPENSSDPESSKGPFHKYLPHHSSPIWLEGFIWRGVFLKMFSRVDGKKVKAEIKGLGNIAVEYLQTETSFKINFQNIVKEKLQENSFLDTNVKNDPMNCPFKFINFILPLICLIESPSWILLGTPIIYNKKHGNEDLKVSEISNYFKRSLFINNLTSQNLKFYFSNSEETSTVFQTPNSSATYINPNNLNSIINNIKNIMPKHDPIYLMYLINQDPNTNIVYFDTPEFNILLFKFLIKIIRSGELDLNSIKQLMGYHYFTKFQCSNMLINEPINQKESNFLKLSSSEKSDILCLDVIRFEYLDWKFQMIYSTNIKNTSVPCIINDRAMEMVYFSSYENKK